MLQTIKHHIPFIFISLAWLIPIPCQAGQIHKDLPDTIESGGTYVFYSHGNIVEGNDSRPKHPRYGVYNFPAIKRELADSEFDLIAYHRPQNTNPAQYAKDLAAQVRQLLDAGVAPGRITILGFSAHWEIQALLRSGISLGDVLKIASWNAGEYISNKLGLTVPFGSVRQGYRADLVLLESNPLASADNLKQITGVMAGGRWRSHVFFDRELASMERVAN